jgi:hypothetical protein
MIARRCQKCGAEIPEGSPVCRSCFEPIKREGFLSRLFRRLGVQVSVETPSSMPSPGVKVNMKVSTRIKIRDPRTGEVREYHSLDEVPEDYREKIRQAQQSALSGNRANAINVTDASGVVHSYHSVEEMPTELRALYEQARGNSPN